jgi:hypothetical protein
MPESATAWTRAGFDTAIGANVRSTGTPGCGRSGDVSRSAPATGGVGGSKIATAFAIGAPSRLNTAAEVSAVVNSCTISVAIAMIVGLPMVWITAVSAVPCGCGAVGGTGIARVAGTDTIWEATAPPEYRSTAACACDRSRAAVLLTRKSSI